MKTRLGFVSNSSSSSFILRKSALNEEQTKWVRAFFEKHEGWYETYSQENNNYFGGHLEAHNAAEEEDDTASMIFSEEMDCFGLTKKDYVCRYEEEVDVEDLK